jgi:hypothetical protein
MTALLHRMATQKQHAAANKADAGNAGIALQLTIGHCLPGVSEPEPFTLLC